MEKSPFKAHICVDWDHNQGFTVIFIEHLMYNKPCRSFFVPLCAVNHFQFVMLMNEILRDFFKNQASVTMKKASNLMHRVQSYNQHETNSNEFYSELKFYLHDILLLRE